MRPRLLPFLAILFLAGCGADSANLLAEGGPASCAELNQACVGLEPANSESDPIYKCQIAAHGDDETECAALNEQLNCLDRCDAAR
jgi:hypothetical protein